jgi:hypothetical protein
VPWFPTKVSDFDLIGRRVLAPGQGIEIVDHPSFSDKVYRKRRDYITSVALSYKTSDPDIPKI